MGPANCAVIGCTNSTYQLKKWQTSFCQEEDHKVSLKKDCGCKEPFKLYMFPSERRNGDKRKHWIAVMKRETNKKTAWAPRPSDRVCSDHFVDGIPTPENPFPSLKLGYDIQEKPKRREITKYSTTSNKGKTSKSPGPSSSILLSPPQSPPPPPSPPTCQNSASISNTQLPLNNIGDEHCYFSKCIDCKKKDVLIANHQEKVGSLKIKINKLKIAYRRDTKIRKPFSIDDIKTDEKINFYTGITSLENFKAIFKMLSPLIPFITLWRGPKKIISQTVRPNKIVFARSRKLTLKNELLLTLMKLRLGLLTEDLADRFGVSNGTCSETFRSWIRFLSMTIGNLVKWLPKESVQENMPRIFKKAGYGNVRIIIDCSEFFIERPKSLEAQAQTWSDYKSHKTLKFLIGISPTGYITFLSNCYGGRASDKYICQDSGFYNHLDPYDDVMADRGFTIREELYLNFCKLIIPPGTRLKSQMTTAEVKKTKQVANLKIHVERAINRMNPFRIFKSVMPIIMIPHCDDIVKTCAGLCNLKPLLYKESKDKKKKN